MRFEIILSHRARRTYDRAAPALKLKIDRALAQIAKTPKSHPNIRQLKGQLAGYWRYRIGDHRIMYRIEDPDRIVIVVVIAHRRDIYE